MKIINRKVIPNTRERYEVHLVEYTKDKTDYEVYSVRSGIYLKDTTAYNRYKGLNRTELDFLLNKYQELKGKAFFTHVQTVPNLQTIRQLEEIRKRINWK